MQAKEHWEHVYKTKSTDSVSWYQAHAVHSLQLIKQTGLELSAPIIDVGGGASTLVLDLLVDGYSNLTVLDLSSAAIAAAKNHIGSERSKQVEWLEANILEAELADNTYELWHDRAVFHFLTAKEDRQKYVQLMRRAIKPGAYIIIATFAEDGPIQCSGLQAIRYSANELHAEFGDSFNLIQHEQESHVTPSGVTQQFMYCHFQKR
ncbi:MAG: class I SAM-dependent methyltransferase [Chlorobiaceae bacterium]